MFAAPWPLTLPWCYFAMGNDIAGRATNPKPPRSVRRFALGSSSCRRAYTSGCPAALVRLSTSNANQVDLCNAALQDIGNATNDAKGHSL
jgi:hypothetical protein